MGRPIDDAFGMGGATVKFEDEGDVVDGIVLAEPKEEQSRDYQTGDPAFWDEEKTRPKMQQVWSLQVEADTDEDPDDDGKRRLYVDKKRLKQAIYKALKDAGVKNTSEIAGGRLWVKYTGRDMEFRHNGKKPAKGNEPKLFKAKFEKGQTPVEDAFDDVDEDEAPF